MASHGKYWYAAAGIAAVAATIGVMESQQGPVDEVARKERAFASVSLRANKARWDSVQAEEIRFRKKGEEIKSLRSEYGQVYKGDVATVTDSTGAERQVQRMQAIISAGKRFWYDADGDSLKALDLAVRDIDDLAKDDALKAEKKHDRYIKAGPWKATWFSGRERDYKFYNEAGDQWAGFTALHDSAGIAVRQEYSQGGVKQTIVLQAGAATVLRWRVESSAPMVHDGGAVRVGNEIVITAPVAWDADGEPVPVAVAVAGDTLVYTVADAGAVYPVTVDPSAKITPTSGTYASTTGGDYSGATYSSARDSVAAVGLESGPVLCGQFLNAYAARVYRAFAQFTLSSGVAPDSGKVNLPVSTNNSTTDFDIFLVAATFSGTATTAWHNDFIGSNAGAGNPWSVTYYSGAYNTSSLPADTLRITLNAAGLAAVNPSGDNKYCIISGEDIANSAPVSGVHEDVSFATGAYMQVWYIIAAPTVTTTAPSSITATQASGGGNITATGGENATERGVCWNTSGTPTTGDDKASDAGSYGTGAYTKTLTPLTASTTYYARAYAINSAGTGYGGQETFSTLANAPNNWNFTETGGDSTLIAIGFGANGNSTAAQYAIRDSTSQQWIAANGARTSTKTWQTAAQWVTTGNITGNVGHTQYRFGVVAKNPAGTETAYLWGTVNNWFFPKAPTAFTTSVLSNTSIRAAWVNNHSANVDSLRIFTSAGAWVKTLAKTDVTTDITGLTPGMRYTFKARVDSLTRFKYSNTDTECLTANAPTLWNFTEVANDTTKLNIGFNQNGNGSGVTYAIRDSTAGKWIASNGSADSTHKVWLSYTSWAALGQLITRHFNQIQRLGIVARDEDGVETAYLWGSTTIDSLTVTTNLVNFKTQKTKQADYATARGLSSGDIAQITTTAADTLGEMSLYGSDRRIYRVSWTAPPVTQWQYIQSGKFILVGSGAYSSTFFIRLFQGTWDAGDQPGQPYYDFSGWQTGVNPYTGTSLIDTFDASAFAGSGANNFVLTATGLGRFTTAAGDSTRWLMTTSNDVSAAEQSEWVIFSPTPAQLQLTYAWYDTIPGTVSVTAIASDSLLVTYTDRDHTETGYQVIDNGTGSVLATVAANATSARIGGLSVNTLYTLKVRVVGGRLDGQDSATDQCYTKAAIPSAPTRSNPADDSTKVVINLGTNPAATLINLFATTSTAGQTLWVDFGTAPASLRSFGTVTMDSSWAWRTRAQAGGDAGVTFGTGVGRKYTWWARAKSGN